MRARPPCGQVNAALSPEERETRMPHVNFITFAGQPRDPCAVARLRYQFTKNIALARKTIRTT